ncbi:hypothetical protein [Rhodococcus sp. ABRD24]|uniref:hypothetical protein n=1 Tax=Rhodococcus sp. ABRD24 TaxID=2507582 RepID=UPI001F623CA6|nr:hypothetical protein [Rhodococcus sp. ABRD24]
MQQRLPGGGTALHEVLGGGSSTIDAIFPARPSTVESNWKSNAHTVLGASAVIAGTDEDPARLRR